MGEENTASKVTPKSRAGWAQPCHATQPPARVAQVDTSPTGLTQTIQVFPRPPTLAEPQMPVSKRAFGEEDRREAKGVRSLEKQGCSDNVLFWVFLGADGGLDLNLHACTDCAVLEKNFKQVCNPRDTLFSPLEMHLFH